MIIVILLKTYSMRNRLELNFTYIKAHKDDDDDLDDFISQQNYEEKVRY